MPRLLVLVALFGLCLDRPLHAQPAGKDDQKKVIEDLKKNLAEKIDELDILRVDSEDEARRLTKKIRDLEAQLNNLLEPKGMRSATLMKMLNASVDTEGLSKDKCKLKQALESFNDQFRGRLPIVVNREAFLTDLGPEAPDPYEEEVILPPVPRKMQAGFALRLLLSQIGRGQATYILHADFIEITTLKATMPVNYLRVPSVVAHFDKKLLKDVLDDLASESGIDIHLDPAVDKKADVPITARFRNATLENALVVVTEMAGLKFVVLERSVYVTTPQNADVLRREEKERESQRKTREPALKRLEAAS